MSKITYALAGSEPENWEHLKIIDKRTGEIMPHVHEIDTRLGWAFNCLVDDDGEAIGCSRNPPCALCPPTTHVRVELLFGEFEIIEPGADG